MAGHPGARARAVAAEARVAELEAQLARIEGMLPENRPKRLAQAVTFNEQTVPALVDELLDRADSGETLEEVAAFWNVTVSEIQEAAERHDLLRSGLKRAQVRALARVHGLIRKALESGKGFPGAMVDRLLAVYGREDRDADDAERVIGVQLIAHQPDGERCSCCTGACQTRSESDGPGDGA